MSEDLGSIAIKLASDPVPNIRFNVAKTLKKLATQVEAAAVSSDIPNPTLTLTLTLTLETRNSGRSCSGVFRHPAVLDEDAHR